MTTTRSDNEGWLSQSKDPTLGKAASVGNVVNGFSIIFYCFICYIPVSNSVFHSMNLKIFQI